MDRGETPYQLGPQPKFYLQSVQRVPERAAAACARQGWPLVDSYWKPLSETKLVGSRTNCILEQAGVPAQPTF